MKNWCVYIVECVDGTFYTGATNNLDKRLSEHNSPNSKTRYTRSRRPVILVYTEMDKTKSEALKREIEIKKLTRKQKFFLIADAIPG